MNDTDTCPLCGRHVERTYPDEPLCTPLSCNAWVVDAKYNHETRQWEPLEPSE